MWRATKNKPDGLYGPDFPELATHIWKWFNELHGSRQQGATGGSSPLSYTDIYSWKTLMGVEPTPWEVSVLIKLDRKFLKVSATKAT